MYISAFMLQNRFMTELSVTDARARLADVVDEARVRHDPIYLTRRGQRVAAVIDADDLDRLLVSLCVHHLKPSYMDQNFFLHFFLLIFLNIDLLCFLYII